MRKTILGAVLLAGMAAPAPLSAQQLLMLEPLNVQARYRFHWNMVDFGNLMLGVEQKDNTRMRAVISTTGLMNTFSQHESTTTLTASNPSPAKGARVYETFYKTKKKPRHVKLAYDTGGAVTEHVVEPPEPAEKRPVVSAELKYGTIDPMTLVMELRERTFEALNANEKQYTLRVFEGRRLMDVEVNVVGRVKMKEGESARDAVKITLSRTPITGFTQKEMAKITDGEPPLEVYFSDDNYFIPLRVQADMMLGSIAADLVQMCDAPCELPPLKAKAAN